MRSVDNDVAACIYVDPVQRDTTLTSNHYDPLNGAWTGFVSASLACPLVNFLSYLFMLCATQAFRFGVGWEVRKQAKVAADLGLPLL